MAQQQENNIENSDVFILTDLALAEASKTFAPFGDPKAIIEIVYGNLGKNVELQQSAGLLIESIEEDLNATGEFQKDLTKALSNVEELSILDLRVSNMPQNLKLLDAQAAQLTKQLKTHVGDLDSTQKALRDIIKQTAMVCSNLSGEIKKILEENGATDVDSKTVDQAVYQLFLSQSGKIKKPEKKIIDALIESTVPESGKKAAVKAIRAICKEVL